MGNDDSEDLLELIEEQGRRYVATRQETTLMVGISREGQRLIRSFRSPDANFSPQPDENTLYEIGSYSKVFTTALLSLLIQQGVLSLDDTMETFFPELDLRPEIAEITVFDLATHTSGLSGNGTVLARMVDEAVNSGDIWKYTYYERYQKSDLDEEIRVAELSRPRASGWEYSRTGLSMLGHILEVASGESYEPLLKRLVCEPLGLSDTTYTLSDEQETRFIHGYDEDGNPSPVWYWGIMLPQGGLRSTMADMLTFAEANLADDDSPLTTALRFARETEFAWPEGSTPSPAPYGSDAKFTQALGWWNLDSGHGPVTQHAGGTFSYQSFGAVHQPTKTGLVTLTSSARNLEDIVNFPRFSQELVNSAVELGAHATA